MYTDAVVVIVGPVLIAACLDAQWAVIVALIPVPAWIGAGAGGRRATATGR